MIKINKVTPLDNTYEEVSIDAISKDYLKQIKKHTNPFDLISNFINLNSYNGFNITKQIERDILTYIRNNFDSIIVGKPSDLERIIILFSKNNWINEINLGGKITEFGIAILNCFGYKERFRDVKSKGIWLAKKLNIKTCPYCNSHYTLIVNSASQKELLKFQFDHFFPKSIYPFLSISMYNLIPSCANCNLIKSGKNLSLNEHYHPYHNNLNAIANFKLKYIPNPNLLTINSIPKQKFELQFCAKYKDPKNIVSTHNELYQIEGIYERHKDIFQELLAKSIIYNQSLKTSLLKIKNLFPNEDFYYRYLLGNYSLHKDILKRPLSKFTQDIARQLKLIP